jgi:O-antigen ligase
VRLTRAYFGPNELLAVTGAAYSALVLYVWTHMGLTAAVAAGSLPLIAVAAAVLLQSGRTLLVAAVFAIPLSGFAALARPLPIPGPSVFPQDAIVVLALGAWAFDRLIYGPRGEALETRRTVIFGWPLVLFGLAIVVATLRGHYAYGATLFGQPLRLVLYAGILVALGGMTVQRLYVVLRTSLYLGTLVTMVWATYFIATGSSQTDAADLSTGGVRILGISTSLYCASTLFFALTSVRLSSSGSARMMHLAMAVLGLFGVVLGFGRAVFAATALVCLVLLAFSGSVRRSIASVVPLALPLLVLVAIFLPRVAPDAVEAARARISSPPATDANVQWREEANKAVFAQVRENPLFGVGFGRSSHFFIAVPSRSGVVVPVRVNIGQDPHNGYLYLWAGGGLAALGTFLVLVGGAYYDGVRRYVRTADATSKSLLLWCGATLFAFLFNAASGTALDSPFNLLTIWLLLSIPAVVVGARDGPADAVRPDSGVRRRLDRRRLQVVS